jgi:peptidoglycan-associated lipoprotein
MNIRSLSMLAAVLLLAACADKPATTDTGGSNTMTSAPPPASSGVTAGSLADFQQNVGDRVFFDFDRSDIKSEGQQTLQRQAQWLQRYANVTVTIAGNCDDRGTREYNLALGERRANAAKKALVALGVAPNRISTISYGKERPSVPGDNDAAWAQNRNAITQLNGVQ